MHDRFSQQRLPAKSIVLFLFACALAACPPFWTSEVPPAEAAGANLVEVPDPLSGENPRFPLETRRAPEPGASVSDARLGTAQTRVVATPGLRHEYSRHDPYNCDGTLVLLLLITDGEWRVYRTSSMPYDQPVNLVRMIELEEPRWDPADPSVLWGVREFAVVRIDLNSGAETVVKDFRDDAVVGPVLRAEADLYRITMKDEGEASADRRYWAFIVQGMEEDYRARYLLVWDRQDDEVLALRKLSAAESRIDWVGMSPRGNWVVIGADYDNAAPLNGLVFADRALTEFHQLEMSTGHADVGLDAEGREVIVMQNAHTDYVDLIPLEASVHRVDPNAGYGDTGHVPLVKLFYASDSPVGLNSGVHVSCNFPGWAVVSTTTDAGAPEQNWLDRTVLLVRLDRQRPRAFYVAKVYGTRGDYWEETQATISHDGRRILWTTNWNENVGESKVWDVETRLAEGWEAAVLGPAKP